MLSKLTGKVSATKMTFLAGDCKIGQSICRWSDNDDSEIGTIITEIAKPKQHCTLVVQSKKGNYIVGIDKLQTSWAVAFVHWLMSTCQGELMEAVDFNQDDGFP
jgi:hypothetical protein